MATESSINLGLARASNVYIKILEIDPTIDKINILGRNVNSIFSEEHNQRSGKETPQLEIRLN